MLALVLFGTHAGSARFDELAKASRTLPDSLRSAVMLLALVGFGTKAGLVPLHVWLPRAHPVAPANASALLSGVMLNVAIYGLVTTCFAFAAPLPTSWGLVILAVGLLSACVGSLYARASRATFKALLAYSSIEHLGIVVSRPSASPFRGDLAPTHADRRPRAGRAPAARAQPRALQKPALPRGRNRRRARADDRPQISSAGSRERCASAHR